MKKIKRLAALVLAGVMMMLTLTACGGSGAMTPAAQFEKKFSDAITSVYGSSVKDIKNETKEALKNVTENGWITENTTSLPVIVLDDDEDLVYIIDTEEKNGKSVSLTATMVPLLYTHGNSGRVNYYTESQLLNVANADISGLIKDISDAISEMASSGAPITGVGVATKRLSDGTYTFAVSMKVKL